MVNYKKKALSMLVTKIRNDEYSMEPVLDYFHNITAS